MKRKSTKSGNLKIEDNTSGENAPDKLDPNTPCGMRNVGSSCWYNSVVQGLVVSLVLSGRLMLFNNRYDVIHLFNLLHVH